MTMRLVRRPWVMAFLAAVATLAGCAVGGREPEPPTMAELLHDTWQAVAAEHGAAAADSQFATLRERNTALRTAFRSRDIGRVAAAQEALYEEQVSLVAGALGVGAARRMLDPVTAMVERRTARVEALRAEGRPVSHMERPLLEAAALRDSAEAAAASGDAASALDLALRAADRVLLLRGGPGT
jgi:hypothetical protein